MVTNHYKENKQGKGTLLWGQFQLAQRGQFQLVKREQFRLVQRGQLGAVFPSREFAEGQYYAQSEVSRNKARKKPRIKRGL